jgi:hypothetical protein
VKYLPSCRTHSDTSDVLGLDRDPRRFGRRGKLSHMTDILAPVVVSYECFLERRGRRQRVAAELLRQEQVGTIDSEAVSIVEVSPTANAAERVRSPHPTHVTSDTQRNS